MKKLTHYFNQLQRQIYFLWGVFMSFPALADLPTPPAKDIANSSNDWADVGGTLIFNGSSSKYLNENLRITQ